MIYLPRSNRLKSVKFTDILEESFPVSHFLHDFLLFVCGTGILHINMSKCCSSVRSTCFPFVTSVWNRDYLAINNSNASLSWNGQSKLSASKPQVGGARHSDQLTNSWFPPRQQSQLCRAYSLPHPNYWLCLCGMPLQIWREPFSLVTDTFFFPSYSHSLF